jgi:hypothetical protein
MPYLVATVTSGSTPVTATPAISPASGIYSTAQTVTITCSTPSSTIYYTTNGATPTTASSVYTGPIIVSVSTTVNAIGATPGYSVSGVASMSYVIEPVAATPQFAPPGGTYTSSQSVMITSSTSGASIYYTTNGTTPTTSATLYVSPIAVSVSETVKAIAVATGYIQSAVGSAAYTINTPVATGYKFHPGDYLISVNTYNTSSGSWSNEIPLLDSGASTASGIIGAVFRLAWSSIETAQGVYNATPIQNAYNLLQSANPGLRFGVYVVSDINSNVATNLLPSRTPNCVPAYIATCGGSLTVNSTVYTLAAQVGNGGTNGYGYGYSGYNGTAAGYAVCASGFWDPAVNACWIKFWQWLATVELPYSDGNMYTLDEHPLVECVWNGNEVSYSFNQGPYPVNGSGSNACTLTHYWTNYLAWATAAAAAFPHTMVGANVTFGVTDASGTADGVNAFNTTNGWLAATTSLSIPGLSAIQGIALGTSDTVGSYWSRNYANYLYSNAQNSIQSFMGINPAIGVGSATTPLPTSPSGTNLKGYMPIFGQVQTPDYGGKTGQPSNGQSYFYTTPTTPAIDFPFTSAGVVQIAQAMNGTSPVPSTAFLNTGATHRYWSSDDQRFENSWGTYIHAGILSAQATYPVNPVRPINLPAAPSSNPIGINFAAGGAAQTSYEGLPIFKNRVRESRGFTVYQSGSFSEVMVAVQSNGWPAADFGCLLYEGGNPQPWQIGTWYGGFVGTGAETIAAVNCTVSNIVHGTGGAYSTFQLTVSSSATAFGFNVSGTTGGATKVFCNLPAYTATTVDFDYTANSVPASAYTTDAINHYSQYGHLRIMWPSNALENTAQGTSSNRHRIANCQARQSGSPTSGWGGVQRINWTSAPTSGATTGTISAWSQGAGIFGMIMSGTDSRIVTVGSGTSNVSASWSSGGGALTANASTQLSYDVEGFPIDWYIGLANACNIGLYINLPIVEDGTGYAAGSYSSQVLTLLANTWTSTGTLYFETANELWEGNQVSYMMKVLPGLAGYTSGTSQTNQAQYMGYRMRAFSLLAQSVLPSGWWGVKAKQILAWETSGNGYAFFSIALSYMATSYGAPASDVHYIAIAPYMNPPMLNSDSIATIESNISVNGPSQALDSSSENIAVTALYYGIPMMTYESGGQYNGTSPSTGASYNNVTNLGAALGNSGMVAPVKSYYQACLNSGYSRITHFSGGVSGFITGNSPQDELSNNYTGLIGGGNPNSNSPTLAALQSFMATVTPTRNVVTAPGGASIVSGYNFVDNVNATAPPVANIYFTTAPVQYISVNATLAVSAGGAAQAWGYASQVLAVTFSTGEVRNVTFISGSSLCTWNPANPVNNVNTTAASIVQTALNFSSGGYGGGPAVRYFNGHYIPILINCETAGTYTLQATFAGVSTNFTTSLNVGGVGAANQLVSSAVSVANGTTTINNVPLVVGANYVMFGNGSNQTGTISQLEFN